MIIIIKPKTFFVCIVLMALISGMYPTLTVASNDAEESINLIINGQPMYPDVPPQIINGRTMVPIRTAVGALNLVVSWEPSTMTVTAQQGETIITLVVGGKAYKNGAELPMDVPATIVDERTLVPLGFLSKAFSANVSWDPNTRTVSISTSQSPVPTPVSAESLLSKGLDYLDAKNDVEAFKYLKQSADLGNSSAQDLVGHMYYSGRGITKDYDAGRAYFLKAASQGESNAQLMMAYTYYLPLGVAANLSQALEWFKKSADNGNADAQGQLGTMYLLGSQIPQDLNKALDLLTLSAAKGNAFALASLGRMYYMGSGVGQDINKAFNLFLQSAQKGDPIGQLMLAGRYLLGEGVAKNHTEAVKWYRASAEQGNAEAQWHLGMAYLGGVGIDSDRVQAKYWFQKSAAKGFQPAIDELNKPGW